MARRSLTIRSAAARRQLLLLVLLAPLAQSLRAAAVRQQQRLERRQPVQVDGPPVGEQDGPMLQRHGEGGQRWRGRTRRRRRPPAVRRRRHGRPRGVEGLVVGVQGVEILAHVGELRTGEHWWRFESNVGMWRSGPDNRSSYQVRKNENF